MRLNPVGKSLWQRFGKAHTKAWAGLGCAGLGWTPKIRPQSLPFKYGKSWAPKTRPHSLPFKTGLGWVESAGLGWAGLGWPGLGWAGLGWAGLAGLGWAPKTRPQSLPFKTGKRSGTARPNGPKTDRKRSRLGAKNDASESSRKKPLAELSRTKAWTGLWAGLGCTGLGTKNEAPHPGLGCGLGWAVLGWAPKTRPQSHPLKTGKRSGTAAPNRPKTDQKRSVRAAENDASESGRKKPLAEVWQGPHQGLGWAVGWAGLCWAGVGTKNQAAEPPLRSWAELTCWGKVRGRSTAHRDNLLRRQPPFTTGSADIIDMIYIYIA